MSRRDGNYAMDVASRALRWRHQRVMRALTHGNLDIDPAEALLLVVLPPQRFLEASIAAVCEREKVAA